MSQGRSLKDASSLGILDAETGGRWRALKRLSPYWGSGMRAHPDHRYHPWPAASGAEANDLIPALRALLPAHSLAAFLVPAAVACLTYGNLPYQA